MKLNRKWLMVIALIVSMATAISGTLAYLTDRDSEANVFTIGNVEIELNETFEQGETLVPGVDIQKEATITNTGKNDAWVWLTVLLPEEMGPYTAPDNMSASNNVVHWNYPAESAANITVDFNTTPVAIDTNGDGKTESYYQTNMLWKNILPAGETTGVMLSKVYMDTRVDIDPDGNMYWVVDGVATDLGWNINTNGNPTIHVSAYAIQTEGFDTVQDAYAAYNAQWGTNGTEYVTTTTVSSNEELNTAIADGASTIVLGSGEYIIPDSAQGKTLTFIGDGNTVIATQDDGSYEGCDYSLQGSTVTFENITINTDSSTYTGYARLNATYNNCTINGTYTLYGDSEFNGCTFNVSGDAYNIWTWGAPNVIFNNCTFNSDGKALLLYGTVNTNLTVNGCTFNDKGGLTDLKAAIEIGNDYDTSYTLTVNNTTVNGYAINDKGTNTGSTLWANKNSMGTDKLNVVVDGVDVY